MAGSRAASRSCPRASSGVGAGPTPNRRPKAPPAALPAGADVLLQVHYHKSGKPETDASTIGLYFAKGPVDKQIRSAIVLPPRTGFFGRPELRIPPATPNTRSKAS